MSSVFRASPLRLCAGIAVCLLIGVMAFGLARNADANSQHDIFDARQKAAIDAQIRQYILNHPEILPQAMERLRTHNLTQAIAQNRTALETPFAGAWAGARDGDVILVEFFDYNCPYCRKAAADVARLLQEDKKLKVVYRDFPILGPASREAAMASLSAARQGRYSAYYKLNFHEAGRPNHERTLKIARKAGMNVEQMTRDLKDKALETEIEKNIHLGQELGLTGTPSYVIGNQIISGAVGYDELKAAIATARKELHAAK